MNPQNRFIQKLGTIAKSKGLIFQYEGEDGYTCRDRRTNELLMIYAPITIHLQRDECVWRNEFNKLRSSN